MFEEVEKPRHSKRMLLLGMVGASVVLGIDVFGIVAFRHDVFYYVSAGAALLVLVIMMYRWSEQS